MLSDDNAMYLFCSRMKASCLAGSSTFIINQPNGFLRKHFETLLQTTGEDFFLNLSGRLVEERLQENILH